MDTSFSSREQSLDHYHQCLLDNIANGSREAFTELYDFFYTPLVRFIYRYTRSTESIEEIVNDTMLVVWQSADRFQGKSRVSTWVMGIAARRALKHIEKDRRWMEVNSSEVDSVIELPTDEISAFSRTQALEWAMSQLSREHSSTVELSYYYGFTCEEIADIFDCPVNTVKSRLHYARKRLHQIFVQCKEPMYFESLFGGHR